MFHGPVAEQQDPVSRAVDTIKQLGAVHDIDVTATTDPAAFTAAGLSAYRSVVFLSATGAALNRDQESALQSYVKAGGGFVGIADAARAQVDSTWFTGLIGTRPAGAIPVAEPVARVTASGENPPNETKEKLTDGDANTKWLVRTPTAWVAYELSAPKTDHRVRADVGQRLRRPGPEGLDPAGLHGRAELDRPGPAHRADLPGPVPDPAVRHRHAAGVHALPAERHREQR